MAISPAYVLLLVFTSVAGIIILFSLRLLAILPPYRGRPEKRRRNASRPPRILVVLGSGGHTAEMLAMLENINMLEFHHRTYVISSGDSLSADKARAFERRLEVKAAQPGEGGGVEATTVPMVASRKVKASAQRQQQQQQNAPSGQAAAAAATTSPSSASYTIHTLPRARRIHQPLYTAPYTSVLTLLASLSLLHSIPYPDIIITNGPATGVIVVLASLILRFFDIADVESEGRGGAHSEGGRGLKGGEMRCVYVESWARVKKLSLSGRLLLRVADRVLVQWERLEKVTGGRGEYRGVLV